MVMIPARAVGRDSDGPVRVSPPAIRRGTQRPGRRRVPGPWPPRPRLRLRARTRDYPAVALRATARAHGARCQCH